MKLTSGEPDASKVARPVRGRVGGKGASNRHLASGLSYGLADIGTFAGAGGETGRRLAPGDTWPRSVRPPEL